MALNLNGRRAKLKAAIEQAKDEYEGMAEQDAMFTLLFAIIEELLENLED